MPDGTSTTTTTTQPWYSGVAGVDQEIVGHWTNAGWINKSAAEVALEATKSWKAAERNVGAPADQIIRVPKDIKDELGWKAVWSRLGKPNDAKEYDFSAIKYSDGTELDETFVNTAREWAFKFNLPKEAAAGLTQEFIKYLDSAEVSEKTERDAKLAAQKAALKINWGPNEPQNMFVAQRAAAALGVAPETVKALEEVIGYDKVMEMFRVIGSKIGEDKFITGGKGPDQGGGVMTRDQAIARKKDLLSDPVWAKAYGAGDRVKLREMTALSSIETGIPVPPELMEFINAKH